MSTTVYVQVPSNGASNWRESVSTATALPATANNTDVRVAMDTGDIYEWTGSTWQQAGGSGGSGTVTSVGLTDSTGLFTVTGSPVTTSGSLTLSAFASQSANKFLAGPSGSSGASSFRAIVSADLPSQIAVAKSSAFTASVGNTYILSGSNYAVAFPDATSAGSTQTMTFIVASNPVALSGSITFTFVGGQTGGGFATYAVYTKGESIQWISDGSNWQIVSHHTDTGTLTDVAIVPANFGTVSSINTSYRRENGSNCHFWGRFTGGTATSSSIQLGMPTNFAIDSTAFQNNHVLQGLVVGFIANTYVDVEHVGLLPYYNGSDTANVYAIEKVGTASGGTFNYAPLAANAFSSNNVFDFDFIVPISGWRP